MSKMQCSSPRYVLGLGVGALGVVYGDIGTSPLYALRECFHGGHGIPPVPGNVLGVLSLIVWSLVLIVSVKYLGFVLRAHNKGEGGILALLALAVPDRTGRPGRGTGMVLAIGIFGAALLYGDGVITPAISVLSAVEGLEVATPVFRPYIVPLTVAILILLFTFQRFGTGRLGRMFGVVTSVWFVTLGALGVKGIIAHPGVLNAVNPWLGMKFLASNGAAGFVVLGAVFLVVTGAEALYADMGHFGRKPIVGAWFLLVFPSLLLNYFGQGALLLMEPAAAANPFYKLAPEWALYPMVILATAATVIASQALISGAYSLTLQAIQLGYLPRMRIDHTSPTEKGQVYLPHVNWVLMIACVGLVLGFRSSSNLAAAYGVAVTLTMIITTMLFYLAARRLWCWSAARAAFACAPFLMIELGFFGANALKITQGGWFPLIVGAAVFTILTTWKKGRRLLWERLKAGSMPVSAFMEDIRANPPARVAGTAIFLSGRKGATPLALLHNLKHNKVLHERVVFLTVVAHETPFVPEKERIELKNPFPGFFELTGNYGFMEEADVPRLLASCASRGLEIDPAATTYFLSKETVIPTERQGMAFWREYLFAVMSRNAQSATAYFKLPPNRVVELGMQVEI